MPTLALIPTFIAIACAVAIKCRRHKWIDALLLSLGGGCALFNALIMYEFFVGEVNSHTLRCIQQVASCLIVPITFTYIARQMSNRWFNSYSICVWADVLLLFTPTGPFTLDGIPPLTEGTVLDPMRFYFFRQGHEVFAMQIADVVLLMQGFIILVRIITTSITLYSYDLSFSPRLRYLLLWATGAISFILFTSFHNTKELAATHNLYIYYIIFSILLTSVFAFLALDLDLHHVMKPIPKPTSIMLEEQEEQDSSDAHAEDIHAPKQKTHAEETVVPDLGAFIHQSRAMAKEIHQMIDQKAYLNPNINVEEVIRMLRTNRTYFSRMMQTEFGCTFTELITRLRMEHADNLLRTTNLSIADVALQSGFADDRTFSRRFRIIYGVSPSKYRGGGNNGLRIS